MLFSLDHDPVSTMTSLGLTVSAVIFGSPERESGADLDPTQLSIHSLRSTAFDPQPSIRGLLSGPIKLLHLSSNDTSQ